MTLNQPERRNSIVGGLLVLLARGILLWIVVPLASFAWLIVAIRLRRRGVTYFQYLGWIDLNMIALLQRTLFRPFVRWPVSYVSPKGMASVTHRLRLNDPA